MAVARGGGASTGLPPGVFVGPLGARFVAFLIDRSVPVLISGLASILIVQVADSRTIVSLIAGVLILAWGLLVWQMYAVRAAGPGMRLMKLQLVGYTDGRPIGWGRFLLRWLVLSLLAATGIGLLLMIIFLLLHPRKQGWHDLAADSVVIKERVLAPAAQPAAANADPAAGPRTAQVLSTESPAPSPTPSAAGVDGPADASSPYRSHQPGAERDEQSARGSSALPEAEPLLPPAHEMASAQPTQDRSVEQQEHPPARDLETEATAEQPVPTASMALAERDARPLDRGWRVALDDGREIEVSGVVLLGRNPRPQPGEEDAQLIKVSDESRTVSKTHLGLGVDGNGMFVMDRNSTNGSTVTTSDGQSRKCSPGDIVPVQPGTVVSFGDHWLEVRRP